MTAIQQKIYTLILTHYQKKGYSPTEEELAKKMGVVRQTVAFHVNALVKKGLINKPRKGILIPKVPVDNSVA